MAKQITEQAARVEFIPFYLDLLDAIGGAMRVDRPQAWERFIDELVEHDRAPRAAVNWPCPEHLLGFDPREPAPPVALAGPAFTCLGYAVANANEAHAYARTHDSEQGHRAPLARNLFGDVCPAGDHVPAVWSTREGATSGLAVLRDHVSMNPTSQWRDLVQVVPLAMTDAQCHAFATVRLADPGALRAFLLTLDK
ncbi:MAG: hypothetical protein ACOYB0_08340 [Polynucleobacter sp.]